jgi:ferredoxin
MEFEVPGMTSSGCNYKSMNPYVREPEFGFIPKMLLAENDLAHFLIVMNTVKQSDPAKVSKKTYQVDDDTWWVYQGETFKMTLNKSRTYHDFFCKTTGFNLRFGRTLDDDPEHCALGPEIADIEVVTGSCPKVSSENCRWCYKNNTSSPGKVMTFEEFKKVVKSFPENLTQVALGITGVKSNPHLEEMLVWLRENGIIGNLTLTGADLDDHMTDVLCQNCGACAVSCYDKAKDLCYATIKKLYDTAKTKFNKEMSINMHIVIADFSMSHVMDVLNDIKNGKVHGLKSIVMLHAKPVGRAKTLDCTLSKRNLKKVIDFCLNSGISFGFDSCNGHNVQDILVEMGKGELCSSIEPCESARMSVYVNVEGKITPCSFVEHVYEDTAIDLLNTDVKIEDIWMKNDMLKSFRNGIRCSKSCPVYALDIK